MRPGRASYNPDYREFILPHDEVRLAASPDDTLLEFLQTTHTRRDAGGVDRASSSAVDRVWCLSFVPA